MTERDESEPGDVRKLSRFLESLPAPQKKVTKQELISALAPAIAKARRAGHTLRAIAAHLQSQGLNVSYKLLCNTVPPLRPRRKAHPSNRAKPAAPKTPAAVKKPDPPSPVRPSKAPEKPVDSTAPVFPPGATFIPLPGGRFLPKPDSDDL